MSGENSSTPTSITLPWASDFHCHLRQGAMMETVTPMGRPHGPAMPNLTPPLTTTQMAVDYGKKLQKLAPNVHFILTLYLNPALTPAEIPRLQQPVYPSGVTTNSDWGAMQEANMVLCLHGECPSDAAKGICILNAEERFLATLRELHQAFPKLRIVLEHATTQAAVEHTVGCTITAHHLFIIIDDWAGHPHHFCKPVAKFPHDRDALRERPSALFPWLDSAPHPRSAKQGEKPAAGVFTTPILIPLMATLFDKMECLDKLEGFISTYGRQFYGLPEPIDGTITLVRLPLAVPAAYAVSGSASDGETVVPFMASTEIGWSIAKTE
ncbi:hypothetical protein BX661DRAFT_194626 [Kickxella alabastrina]|uniref:uncharacterized protein n=1 Tax=Kickxella alabastrina TaxID=61397 RepID=UPI00221F10EF|nr:uncharacterized protein BX661DRAFT_194626 [Kickxella alabastrina]KAI7821466.1 hypothetical protein BX661DRAFT_194626 [Kickxella alabastrina]